MATVTTTRATNSVAPTATEARQTFSDTTVSLAAAYGITPRTVATKSAAARCFRRMPVLTSAAGVAAAMVLGVSLWLHAPVVHHGPPPADAANFEDLDIVASSDNSQDNVEMLQDDLDFYAWAEKT